MAASATVEAPHPPLLLHWRVQCSRSLLAVCHLDAPGGPIPFYAAPIPHPHTHHHHHHHYHYHYHPTPVPLVEAFTERCCAKLTDRGCAKPTAQGKSPSSATSAGPDNPARRHHDSSTAAQQHSSVAAQQLTTTAQTPSPSWSPLLGPQLPANEIDYVQLRGRHGVCKSNPTSTNWHLPVQSNSLQVQSNPFSYSTRPVTCARSRTLRCRRQRSRWG